MVALVLVLLPTYYIPINTTHHKKFRLSGAGKLSRKFAGGEADHLLYRTISSPHQWDIGKLRLDDVVSS